MKRIVVLSGSPRMKDGYTVVNSLLDAMGDKVEMNYINVNRLNVKNCVGCMQCFNEGEGHCPMRDDDVAMVERKLLEADGIIFLSPVYAMGITGSLKRVMDRLAYIFHRPLLIAKPIITVVTTGGSGIKESQSFLKMVSRGFGCHLVGALSVQSSFYFEGKYHNPKYKGKIDGQIAKLAAKFHEALYSGALLTPSLYNLSIFNGLRTKAYMFEADRAYWLDKGWMDSDYYYDVKMGLFKRFYSRMLKALIRMMMGRYLGKETVAAVDR